MTPKTKGLLWAAAAVAIGALQAGSAFADEIVWWVPNWREDAGRDLAKKFEAANPGTTVKIEVTVADGLPTKILTALHSGSPPDLINAQHGWVVPYAQQGLIQPVDDAIDNKDDFYPAAIQYDTWDSKLWGVPYRIESIAMLYNKDMFKAAGLDPENPPQTWDQLIDAAKKLTHDDQYGFAITGGGEFGNTVFRSLPFIWENGGSIISEDMTKATVNEPAAVAAVKFYTDMLVTYHVSPPSTLQNDGTANRHLFASGKAAMYEAGQFDLPAVKQENPKINIGVMMMVHPEGKDPASILGGWSLVIPKDAPNAAGAKKLVKFLSQPDNMAELTYTFPARKSAMSMPQFQDPELKVFKDMLPYARTLPAQKNWIQITQAYFNGVQSVLTGDAEPQAAMDQAADDINGLLQQ